MLHPGLYEQVINNALDLYPRPAAGSTGFHPDIIIMIHSL